MSSTIISETWIDEHGYHRHSNCRGIACAVPNCRQSQIAERIDGPNSLPDNFIVQVVQRRGNTDPLKEPVANVVDGWDLKDGDIHLYVRCEDNVTRTVTLPRRR